MKTVKAIVTAVVLMLGWGWSGTGEAGVKAAGSSAEQKDRNGFLVIERNNAIFHVMSTRYLDIADSILAATKRRLFELTHDTLPYKPAVYIVENAQVFDRLLRGHFPDWGAAAALPEREAIVIKSPAVFNLGKSLPELLAHEYTHLVIAHRCGFYAAPRWFDEGMAMLMSTEWSWSDNLAMGKAAIFQEFIPLKEIKNVNRFNESKAQIAYAQSYLAVDYLIHEYGKEAIDRFLTQIAQGKSVDDALVAASGANYREFQQEFENYLNTRYNAKTILWDTMYFWVALAIIVVIAGLLRYRKRRQYYKKWAMEEQLQSTDFDYGDPEHPEKIDDEDEPWRE